MSGPWKELLPVSAEVGGVEYDIRSDYRAALDLCAALSDPELDGQERAAVALEIFYPDAAAIPPEHYEEAVAQCLRFLSGGVEEEPRPGPRLVDWSQDFPYIAAPINRVMGQEIRSAEYLHWWTFLAAYYEIGECTFSQIVSIRDKLARGKALDKSERAWYARNRHLVDFKRKYTEREEAVLSPWLR